MLNHRHPFIFRESLLCSEFLTFILCTFVRNVPTAFLTSGHIKNRVAGGDGSFDYSKRDSVQ